VERGAASCAAAAAGVDDDGSGYFCLWTSWLGVVGHDGKGAELLYVVVVVDKVLVVCVRRHGLQESFG